jgi:hypothetical protein
MAIVPRRRRFARFGLGDLAQVQAQLATLPYAYASLFPGVNFDALSDGTTIGDLVRSGAISPGEYQAAFGPLPSADDPNIQQQYNEYVRGIQAGIASGMYTSDSLAGVTIDWWIDRYTPFGASAKTRGGGYTQTATGDTEFVNASGAVVPDAFIPSPAPTPTVTAPARYLQQGIEFLQTGEVVSVGGQPVTGKTLTPDQVQRLTSGGSLTAGELSALTPTATTPTPAAGGNVLPQTGQVLALPGSTPATDLAGANQGSAGNTVLPSGGMPSGPVDGGGGLVGGLSLTSPVVLGIAALAVVLLAGRRSRR